MSIPRFSILRPVTTLMIYVAVALLGIIAWTRLPQELFPSITYPQISVVTQYKDAAPEEIELLVTNPIEEVVGTVPGVRRISSISKEEVSLVIAEFAWGTNMDFAALGVREKIDLIKERLPRGSEDPIVVKFNPFEQPALVLNVSGAMPPYELLQMTRRQIKDILEKVEGVASVNITGGVDREVLIEVDQGRLSASKTSIVSINEALAKANLNYPAGTIKEAFYEYLIRTIGEFNVVPEMKEIAVNTEDDESRKMSPEQRQKAQQRQQQEPLRRERGIVTSPRLVLLKDIAHVKDTFKERTSVSRFNGRENISLEIQKQSGANTVKVVTATLKALDQVKRSLPAGVEVNVASDQSLAIRQAVQGVADAAWQGALLAFLVLLVFLKNPWSALNVTAAIPISVLVTLGFMYFSNVSVNVISMGGLALGVGLLVDAGIVVIENIDRHRDLGKPLQEAAMVGTEEVGGALWGSILTNIVPFLPLIFVYGLVGQLFKDLAFTVTFSNLASLAVSLTLTPLIASRIRRRGPSLAATAETTTPLEKRRMSKMARAELRVVRWFLDHSALGIFMVVAAFLVSLAIFQTLPQEFLPKVDQGHFAIQAQMPPGTRLDVTDRVVQRIEKQIIAHPAVKNITVNIGSTKGEGTGVEAIGARGAHQAQILVTLRPKKERKISTSEVIQQLRSSFEKLALEGIDLEFVLEEAAFKAEAFASAPVVLEVRGQSLEVLQSLSQKVQEGLLRLPGFYGVKTSLVPPSPETKVRVLKDRAAAYHLTVSDVALTAQTAIRGFIATKFKEAGKEIDVRVRLRAQDRHDLGKVRRLEISSPLGMSVPLAEVAYLAVGRGPTEIRRLDRQRTLIVSANLFQRPLGEAMKDVSSLLAGIQVPAGYEIKISGEREEMEKSFQSLLWAALMSFLLVYMVMAATFESLWQPFLIMATIPMALSGVVLALVITRTPVSAMVGLGIMLLGGIVVNNGIVLLDFVNQLRRQGLSLYDALLQASQTRLRPIVMTAATAVLGLVPLALGLSEGSELQGPMGITMMGGLISATFLTLVFLPTICYASETLLVKFFPQRAAQEKPENAALGVPGLGPELALAGGLPTVATTVQPTIYEPPPVPEIPEDFGNQEAVPEEKPDLSSHPSSLEIPEPAAPEVTPKIRPEIPEIKPEQKSETPPEAKPPILPLPGPEGHLALPEPPSKPIELPGPEATLPPEPPPIPSKEPFVMTQRQQWLLDQLKIVGRMTRKDYALRVSISIPTAARDLKELVDARYIRGVGPLGPGRAYELVSPP